MATRADPGQLENAVLNLVINARDAMPEGGVITIATRNASLIDAERDGLGKTVWRPAITPCWRSSDTGTGMSADTLKRVFEPFFTTKDVGKGSGLGLSMVYGFVKQSGGHVHIRSELGQRHDRASVFSADAGGGRERVASTATGAGGLLPRGEETVLVVEDNAEVRATAVEISRRPRLSRARGGERPPGAGAVHATPGHRAGVLGHHAAGRAARHDSWCRSCASGVPA